MKRKTIKILTKQSGLTDFEAIKLPKDGLVDIIHYLTNKTIGKAKISYKHGEMVAEILELDSIYYDCYLEADINELFGENDSIGIYQLTLYNDIFMSHCGLTVKEQLDRKNYIQDKFNIDKVHELMKKNNVSVRDISDYTGIQYNSLYQYIGGEKSKPILPMSKVVKSDLYLYFKAQFGFWY